MTKQRFSNGGYVQVSYIVADVEAAAREWVELRGAGPFFLKPYKTQGEVSYRGEPATLDHVSAFGQFGSVMVELIQPLGDAPSVYRDIHGGGDQGLHHFAEICADIELAINAAESLGYPLVARSGTPQTPAVFVDARHELGHMIELCQESPQLRYLYQFVADAARNWDGTNPVRSLVPGK